MISKFSIFSPPKNWQIWGAYTPLGMIDNKHCIDSISFAELLRRIQLPVLSSHVTIIEALRNLAEFDSFGPPDQDDLDRSRDHRLAAFKDIWTRLRFSRNLRTSPPSETAFKEEDTAFVALCGVPTTMDANPSTMKSLLQ